MRLGSLRQLTLLSFFIALIPLIALLWQSQRDLASVAGMTARDNSYFVDTVSSARQLENRANDLSRLVRQYQVLTNSTLLGLIEEQVTLFEQDLLNVCEQLPNYRNCANILVHVHKIQTTTQSPTTDLLEAGLETLSRDISELRKQVSTHINQRINEQQLTMQTLKQKQAWSTAGLALLSLMLIVIGAQLIVQPFKKLKRVIHQIAKQDGNLAEVSKHGPQELIVIEQELHWLADRLNQLEHLRTALLRHASHELKTPLASIKEGCSLLSEEVVGELSQSQQEVVGLLVISTERLSTLVEKLLDYNLLLQQAQPKYQWVDVDQIINQCIEDNRLTLQQHTINVQTDILEIVTDPELYRRILDNLVSNAVAHGATSGPITLSVYQAEQTVVLDVSNHGEALDEELKHNMFEPFVRGNRQRNDQVFGAGLGLSIVADCARIMQGSVEVADVEYADVCFRVSLPSQQTLLPRGNSNEV